MVYQSPGTQNSYNNYILLLQLLMKQAQDAANALAMEKQRMADESNKAMMQAAAMLKQQR